MKIVGLFCTENIKKVVSSVSKDEKTSILTIQVTLSAIININLCFNPDYV